MSECELIARAQRGDQQAFHQLYEDNVGLVFEFLRRRIGAQAAEDLAAETFCRAYEHLPGYEWRGVPLRAWLLRIAYHLVVARSRQKDSSTVVMADPPAVATPGHEDDIVDASDADGVLAALGTLAPSHQSVLELRFVRDLSVGETAAVLDMTPEAVRAMTYRALKALRAAHLADGDAGDLAVSDLASEAG